MKRIILLLGCFTGLLQLSAQVSFTNLKLTPAYPTQSNSLSFEYTKANTPLAREAKVDVAVYLVSKKGYTIAEPVLTEKNGIYRGTVKVADNTSCIAFGFSSGEAKDLNNGKGYIIPVYTDKNTPVKEYYVAANNLQSGMGNFLFGLPNNATQGFQYLEDGVKQYPELKKDIDFVSAYIQGLSKTKKTEAPALINEELIAFEKNGNLTEEGYNFLIQSYTRNKQAEKAESLKTAMKAAFPEGEWVKQAEMQTIRTAKGADSKVAAYDAYIKKYPPTEKDKQAINFLKTLIATSYAKEKNYQSYNEWNSKLDKSAMATNNNNLAWDMAESGENLEQAKQMAEFATTYAKTEMKSPSGPRPETMTSKQWEDQRNNNYAMFGDTYAFILYKQGDYATAFPISKEAATINKLKDPEYNERYAMLAEKVLPPAETKKLIEGFVEHGTASVKTKEILKNVYIKENNGDKGFDEYISKLEVTARENKRNEIAKGALNEPSPKFNLKDFEGKSVSLDDLKGKVVVVDFWATWCGPCIASMPGMNKALTKYKDNSDVKFLFVDTWESAEDKLKNAKSFMEKKNYPFYVLMDNENKMVEDFNVSGIPTKFIIDKQGRIRFKAVGFSGNDDELVDELSTMIDLASK